MSRRPATARPFYRNPLYIVAAAVLAVAIATALVVSLSGRGPEPIPSVSPVTVPGTRTPAPIAGPPQATPTQVFEIFEGKDPFRPLIVAGSGSTTTTPAPGSTPAPGGSSGTSPTPAQSTTRPGGVNVRVLSVAADGTSATVEVGSKRFDNAKPGQTLSDGVGIVSISRRCVNFRRNSDAFRVCENEQVLK